MTPRIIHWALILGLVLNVAQLHGQNTGEGASETAVARDKVQLVPAVGVRYGTPLGASVYGGGLVGFQHSAGFAGPSLIGEVGQDGFRVSLGVSSFSLVGTQRAQMSYLRMWDDRGDVRDGQTYVGPEIAIGIIGGLTLGHYWRVSDGGGKARIFSIGAFIGI
jgi:hypothetical protein